MRVVLAFLFGCILTAVILSAKACDSETMYQRGLQVGRLRGCAACFRKQTRRSEAEIWEMCRMSGDYRHTDQFEARRDERCL